MKNLIQNLLLLPALVASLGLIPAGRAMAQTFTTLHSFTLGSDGGNPLAGLILSGNTLYGTAFDGGSSDYGTIFKVNTNGTGFTILHSFTAADPNTFINSDGAYPFVGLILSGNTLYGTAQHGGSGGNGTVFAVNPDGTGFTNLYTFTAAPNTYINSDGAIPSGVTLSGNTLYGTAYNGGSSGYGTVFAVNTDGTGFTNLHSFTAVSPLYYYTGTNSDGAFPEAGLILSGNTLYGTASVGGSSGSGTVFAINTSGTGFTNLHSFTALDSATQSTNSDGAHPYAGLILSGRTLYGTAYYGGSGGNGTVFAVNTDGTGFTNLHSFTAVLNSINSDGANPYAGVILSGNTLYGTANGGGSLGYGTVFAVNTNGTGFTTLHSFARFPSDGSGPNGGVILSGNTLYGTTEDGGSGVYGTVFSLTLPPPPSLTIIPSGANVILSWPTNTAGLMFTLQSTTNLISAAGWNTVSPVSAVVSGQNTVTNPITGTQQFYRLSQ